MSNEGLKLLRQIKYYLIVISITLSIIFAVLWKIYEKIDILIELLR